MKLSNAVGWSERSEAQQRSCLHVGLRYAQTNLLLILVLCFAGCASIPAGHEHIGLDSKDYRFIDEVFAAQPGTQRTIDGWLTLPDRTTFKPPFPAVVLLHSSWGLSSQEWHYAKLFADIGIASLAIDSFKPRGVWRTSNDQSLVSTASTLADAYAALDTLANDTRFDEKRIAVMGFSKGGIAAFYSSLTDIQTRMSTSGRRFAAHIAFYPWCGLHFQDMRTTGAPMMVIGGDRDIVTPITRCINLIENGLSDSDQARIELIRYQGARHAFDHPSLQNIPFPIPMDVQVPTNCRFVEYEHGLFIEKSSNTTVSADNIGEALAKCSTRNGVAGRDPESAILAEQAARSFLRKTLLNSIP